MNIPGTDALNDAGKGMDKSFPDLPAIPCVPCAIAKYAGMAHDKINEIDKMIPDPCAFLEAALKKAQEQVAKVQSKVEQYHDLAAAQANQSESDFGGAVDMIPGAKAKHDQAKAYAGTGEDMYQASLQKAKDAEQKAQDALAMCKGIRAAPANTANSAVDQGAGAANDAYNQVPGGH
jgi:hypothetical protein